MRTTKEGIIIWGIMVSIIILVLSFSIWLQLYKFKDCKKVGHSTTYCVLKIGEN